MLFEKIGNYYLASVALSHNRMEQFKLDTGSPFTVISLNKLLQILRCSNTKSVKDELLSYGFVRCISYTKQEARLVPIYIRMVKINDVAINRFYCFVNVDTLDSSSLIGNDFISSCSIGKTEAAYGIELSDFDQQSYETSFKLQCCSNDIHEIYELESIKYKRGSLSSLFDAAGGIL